MCRKLPIYCEFSFFNKKFDEEFWDLKLTLKCLNEHKEEICELNCDRHIDKGDDIVFVREGWGIKNPGGYWKVGNYRWEAFIEEVLIASKYFYIEGHGIVERGFNPYFKIGTVKLYEGPDSNVEHYKRKYLNGFNSLSTRYIWVEVNAINLARKSTDWAC